MQIVNQLFKFYINASIHVALSVYAFIRITEMYLDIVPNRNLNYFIFFGTITGYNFVKYFGIAKFHHRSLTKKLKQIQVFSLLCFVFLFYFGFQLSTETLLLYGAFGALTVLYAIPFLSGFQKSLRAISYLKIVIVAFVWAGATVILPVLDAGKGLDTNAVLIALQRFLIVTVLILPFDIRDIQYDAISLQTIPRKIGIEKTKKLGYILLLFALVLEFLISPNSEFKTVFLVLFFLMLFSVMRAKVNQSSYYSAFWVESIPVIWWLILALTF